VERQLHTTETRSSCAAFSTFLSLFPFSFPVCLGEPRLLLKPFILGLHQKRLSPFGLLIEERRGNPSRYGAALQDSVVVEYDILFDGLAKNMQLIGWKIRVRVANGYAAQD
jgi:hypothetical protein